MKLIILLTSFVLITAFTEQCKNKKVSGTGIYKARLETKALCMNYTLRLLEGDMDTSLIMASWIDESTGKSYESAFGLGSPCTFPPNIQQGDDFYFMIDSSGKRDCAVCMAYYPTPPKKLSIKVVDK
ncbi:MAG: hypothetical protein ACSLE0_17365 [Chitinophagaceae bacterium]